MIEHGFRAIQDHYGRGWLGQCTYAKNGASCTAYVRGDDGMVRIFPDEQSASWAASKALCHALNKAANTARGREVRVSHSGGKPHLTDLAKRVFGATA